VKVLGAYRGDAAGYYRIVAPFSVLRYRTEHEFDVQRASVEAADEYDILWLQQHASATAEIVVREFKQRGKPVIYDVDDWLFGLPASWPCYDHYFERGSGRPKERLLFHERLMRLADVVTCSTRQLANSLREWLGPGHNIRVLPNCIVQGEWDTIIPTGHGQNGPVAGWFGTGSHWDDWYEIAPAVDEALEEVHGYLALIGAPELVTLFPDRLAARTLIHPLVPMRRFGEVRRLIAAFDVGLAWCTNRLTTNRHRSPLKAIQYGAAGVPVVASRTVYGDLPGLCDCGLVVDEPGQLAEVLVNACTTWGNEVRERAIAWQGEVWRSHSYETQAMRWLELIEEIAGGTTGD